VRQHTLFDADWRFFLGDLADGQAPGLDDRDWRRLNLPHDWSIEGAFDETNPSGSNGGYLPAGFGWYRKTFALPAAQQGQRVWIEFDGVYRKADVWVNGQHLSFHPYGYTGFHYDITDYVTFDGAPNVLAVRVDNALQPDGRWYAGSGIYRHVWLTISDPLHVAHWGTFVTTPEVTTDLSTLYIRTRVANDDASERLCSLVSTVLDAEGRACGSSTSTHPIAAGQEHTFVRGLQVFQPRLWSVEDPYLYTLRTQVREGDAVVDEVETPFGIRTIAFDADQGFLLNGQRVKINGVCLHHDGGCVGAAVPERVWERRLRLLKEMGCNGIRSSHYPPAPEFLDLCDRLGFVVMDEAFDEWAAGKEMYGYHDHFEEWWLADLQSMLHRDRNHPSIVLWSVGNEIPEQCRQDGVAILQAMVDVVHAEDPTRPVTSACDQIDSPYVNSGPTLEAFMELLDVVGYNYTGRWGERSRKYYSLDRDAFPKRKMIGSENPSAPGIRGDYQRVAPAAGRWRGPYTSRTLNAEQLWKFTRDHDYVAGDFMWTGIDHLGEAMWPHKGSSSGVIDVCGFRKDGYYFYQSQWSDKPMAYLAPHWTWPGQEGEVIPVVCYTNCDTAELFVNGKSWGVKSYKYVQKGFDRTKGYRENIMAPRIWATTADLHLTWDVPYEPGTLKVVCRNGGEVVCSYEVVTAGAPARLELTADREALVADGQDVAHLTVRVLDAAGNLVPDADALVRFAVEGPAAIIGVDNGDPTSHAPHKADQRQAFHGLCLAIAQTTSTAGAIRVAAMAEGLEGASVTLTSKA
jgi:beta-galactosidase